MSRKFPREIKRIVVKFGSSVIATYQMKAEEARLRLLVNQICAIRQQGIEVVLVSSGAIVLGMGELNTTARPARLAREIRRLPDAVASIRPARPR